MVQAEPRSVLHVSNMVHIPYEMTRILRRSGWRADYLAVSANPHWSASDLQLVPTGLPRDALREFAFFWRVMARYEVVHLHFMITMSRSGWELPVLRRLGRKVVAHYRGCEIRNRERNMALHPEVNICQECDYDASICRSPLNARRRELAVTYADHVLVTTPDLRDFVPHAEVFPFFAPETAVPSAEDARPPTRPIKIVHATNHPGIEGSREIRAAVDRLRARGYAIDYVHLQDVPHERVLAELRDADLSIGKMKMGHYANAQVESLILGVPAVTYVRPEFVTDAIRESGLILTSLAELEATLEYYLTHSEALEEKRRKARSSALALHDNDALGRRLIAIYERLTGGT